MNIFNGLNLFLLNLFFIKFNFREQNIDLPKLENVITSKLNQSLTQSFQQTKNSNHLKYLFIFIFIYI